MCEVDVQGKHLKEGKTGEGRGKCSLGNTSGGMTCLEWKKTPWFLLRSSSGVGKNSRRVGKEKGTNKVEEGVGGIGRNRKREAAAGIRGNIGTRAE